MASDLFSTSLLYQRPTSPTIWFQHDGRVFALPMTSLRIDSELYVSTALVRMRGVWVNTSNITIDAIFALPFHGSVNSVDVQIGDDRVLETVMLSAQEAGELRDQQEKYLGARKTTVTPAAAAADAKKSNAKGATPNESPYERFIPDLFRLPIPRIKPQDQVKIELHYIETLQYIEGQYNFQVQLCFSPGMLPNDGKISDIVKINCIINAISKETRYESTTHQLSVKKKVFPRILLEAVPITEEPKDLLIRYGFSSGQIMSNLIKTDGNPKLEDPRGAFALFMTPPTMENVRGHFNRHLVFMLDRSGSMTGEPYDEAVRSLMSALEGLRDTDKFSIVAFDHTQRIFSDKIVPANPVNVNRARQWIEGQNPQGGGTDIKTPIIWSINALKADPQHGPATLSSIVLITDGCVVDEREIVQKVGELAEGVRIMTLGIGSYSNWFFLKMLAQIGRGFDEVVVYKENIFTQVQRLLARTAVPILRDISILISQIDDCEIYPFPIPDLFQGSPIIVAGKYAGVFPEQVGIEGREFDENKFEMSVKAVHTDVIPVDRIFLRQRIDLLTAKAWLEDSKEVEAQIVQLSKENNVPSAFTTMVAYETTKDQKAKNDKKERGEGEAEDSKFAGDSVSVDEKEDLLQKPIVPKKKKKMNPKVIGALAVGGAVLVGAAAFSFGDLAGTMDNLPMDGVLGDIGGGGCCGDCCGGDMDDCNNC